MQPTLSYILSGYHNNYKNKNQEAIIKKLLDYNEMYNTLFYRMCYVLIKAE